MKNGYEVFVRPLLFSLDPETAHHLTIKLLGRASHFDVALRALMLVQPTLETDQLIWPDLPKPDWTCGRAGQKRRCSFRVGSARIRFYRDWDSDCKSAAWKSQAAHLSIAWATSVDQSAWFQQRRRGRDCIPVVGAARKRPMAGRSGGNQHRQVESNAARSSDRRLPLLVSHAAGFCRLRHIEYQLAEHTRFARVARA